MSVSRIVATLPAMQSPLDTPLLIATANPHKLEEIGAIFATRRVSVEGLDALDLSIDEPVEDRCDFEGNARLKAAYYARATGRICLADDSGLEVDALGGEPGVISARYAGARGPRARVDLANNAKMVERLRDVPEDQRTARFVCVMVLADAARTWAQVRGTVEGRILLEPRGTNGFGYDPHFFLPELGRTTAELEPEHKNRISHRADACQRMLDALKRLGIGRPCET